MKFLANYLKTRFLVDFILMKRRILTCPPQEDQEESKKIFLMIWVTERLNNGVVDSELNSE